MDARRQSGTLTAEGSAVAVGSRSITGDRTWDTALRKAATTGTRSATAQDAALNRFNRVGVCAEIVEQSAPTRRVFARPQLPKGQGLSAHCQGPTGQYMPIDRLGRTADGTLLTDETPR